MLFFYRCAVHRDLPSFPTRRSSDLDEPEVRRLIQLYHSIDTASVVAEVVRIVDTLLFRPAEGLRLLDATLERRRFPVLEFLAFQAAQFATPADSAVKEFATRRIVRALERRAATEY